MFRKLLVLVTAALLAMAFAFPALSADSVTVDLDESTQLWFVEMSSPPTAAGGRLATVKKEKQKFRNAAGKAGLQFEERFAFFFQAGHQFFQL